MSAPVEGALREAGNWVSGVAGELGRSPWPVPAAVMAAGLLVLLAGARARRPVAVAGAAGVAAASAQWLVAWAGVVPSIPGTTLAAIAAAVCGALAVVVPQIFPVLAGALPAAFLADLLGPADQRVAAVAAGALAGGLAGLLAARPVAAFAASGVGALAVGVGAAGALWGTVPGRALAAHPAAILAAVAILTIAGTAFQLSRAWGRGADAGPKRAPATPVKDAAE
jgi:hypothetical protein